MKTVLAELRARANEGNAIEEAFRTLSQTVLKEEPDCLCYQLFRNEADPDKLLILEVYGSDEASQSHRSSPVVQAAAKIMFGHLEDRPAVHQFIAAAGFMRATSSR